LVVEVAKIRFEHPGGLKAQLKAEISEDGSVHWWQITAPSHEFNELFKRIQEAVKNRTPIWAVISSAPPEA